MDGLSQSWLMEYSGIGPLSVDSALTQIYKDAFLVILKLETVVLTTVSFYYPSALPPGA